MSVSLTPLRQGTGLMDRQQEQVYLIDFGKQFIYAANMSLTEEPKVVNFRRTRDRFTGSSSDLPSVAFDLPSNPLKNSRRIHFETLNADKSGYRDADMSYVFRVDEPLSELGVLVSTLNTVSKGAVDTGELYKGGIQVVNTSPFEVCIATSQLRFKPDRKTGLMHGAREAARLVGSVDKVVDTYLIGLRRSRA